MTNTPALRQELHDLLAAHMSFGDFVLTSGKRSNFYFDGRKVTLSGRGSYLIAHFVWQRCQELKVNAIGGLTLGADPIIGAVAGLSGNTPHPLRGFIVRKEVKDHGTGRLIEGPPLNAGDRVVIVDDVITTGGSFIKALEAVRAAGAVAVEAIAVIDRQEGGREELEQLGLPLYSLFARSEFPAPVEERSA